MPELAALESNEDGWQARLELRLESVQGRTRLTHCRHSGPLRVQRVFFPEPIAWSSAAALSLGAGTRCTGAEPCHIYVLHPPGGLVSGDALQIEVECRERAHGLLTTPAAGKFYRQRGQRLALVTQELRLDGGTLEWLPQENIYYPDSAVRLCTRVHLDPSARFIGWELHCLGLPAIAATLDRGALRTTLELWLGEQPLLLERLALESESLRARWGLANFPAFGTCLAYPARARTSGAHAHDGLAPQLRGADARLYDRRWRLVLSRARATSRPPKAGIHRSVARAAANRARARGGGTAYLGDLRE